MPGYTTWKQLYHEEYAQLFEEGYPVGAIRVPDMHSPYLPFPAEQRDALREDALTPADWEQAYWNVWKVHEQGVRADFPFTEPDDYTSIISAATEAPALTRLDEAEYAERIKGAWFGRCAGVILGKPLELGWTRTDIREFLEGADAYPLDDWVPGHAPKINKSLPNLVYTLPSTRGNIAFVQPDDDINYTVLALLLAERKGTEFTKRDICENWLANLPFNTIYSCTKQAYYHLVNLSEDRSIEEQIDTFPTKMNPMREGINGAIRTDMWGYLVPGDPRCAAVLAHREASVNMVKNGIYSTMFVAGCLSAALSAFPDVSTILAGGYAVIPRQSRLAHALHAVEEWYDETGDWITVCDRIFAAWGHLPFCGAIQNMCFSVLALRHGQLDYSTSITTAAMCGIDTDCTAGTVGSIVGAALGYGGIDQRWITPLRDTVKTHVANFGKGTISELVERSIACHRGQRQNVRTI